LADLASIDDEDDQVGRALADLWMLLGTTEDLGMVLQRLVDLAVRVFPPGIDASITVLADDDRPETVAATSGDVLPLDRAQYAADRGPSLDAARARSPIKTDLDEARERWPEFADAATTAGIVGYLSAPLVTDQTTIGSFNLYSRKPERFDSADAALLTLFTNSALAAVAIADQRRRATALAEHLRTAMESRATIDQAIGMLRERHDLTPAEAWGLLQRQSQNSNVKVRDLAARMCGGSAASGGPQPERDQ
jgi:GAF domain-containing protein